jgi:hypothetical protein
LGEVAVPGLRVRRRPIGSSVDVTAVGESGALTVARGPDGAPCWVQLPAGVHGLALAGLAGDLTVRMEPT